MEKNFQSFGLAGIPNKDGIIRRIEDSNTLEKLNTICSIPKSVKIEISSKCNLKCDFCYNSKSDRHNFMSFEDFKFIIRQIKDIGVKQVGLLLSGEPTLNPYLVDMINYGKDIGIPYIFITTNGILVKDELANNIANSKLDSLKWSINHYTSDSFLKHTGIDGFNQVVENIKNFYKINRNINLYASTVVKDLNNINEELKNFINKNVMPYVKEHYYFEENNQGGLIGSNNVCNRKPLMPCPRLFNNGYITSDLKVVCCCCGFTSKFVVGDLRKQSFMQIWNGEKMQYLRQKHINNDSSNIICTDLK